MVKGFSGKVLEQLTPFITVFSDQPNAPTAPININTAPREVIASLDDKMTDELAARVLDYRKTTPFMSSGDLVKVPGMETIGQALSTNTTAKGAVYRIRSEAHVRETARVVEAVVRISGMQSTVLYWREF